MFKFKFFVFLFCLLLLGSTAFSQQTPSDVAGGRSPVITEAINLDEDIKPVDLGISKPNILPDSPFYAFKNIGRGLRSFFVRDPVKKAELKLKFANEKIIETKELAEKTQQPELLQKALDSYKVETDRLKEEIEKIKETIKENPDLDKFLDKFVDYNIKQQKLIGKLEKELPSEIYERAKIVKEENLAKFSDITLKIAPPEILQEKLIKTIQEQPGSQFKNFKNLEVLKEIEEKVPEPAKEAIRKAQENSLRRLQGDLEKMAPEDRERFSDYVKNIGGNETRHLEIIHHFEAQEIPRIIREEIEKAKERAFERIEKKMAELKQDVQKKEFLKHLEQGKMEDLRIIKELENNLSPETIDKILEIKNRAMKNFREELEKADTPEKQEAFLIKMKELYDAKQFEMFKEMDNLIPEEKKEFWAKIKEKALEQMKRDIAKAKDREERRRKFEKLAGDLPHHLKILEEFGLPPEIMREVMRYQAEKLSQRVGNIEDAARLQFLKQKIEEEEKIKKELENRNPEIFQKIEAREEIFQGEITRERALDQIEKAKKEIVAAETEFSSLDDKTKNEVSHRSPYRVLLTNAQKKINLALVTIENELFGKAFGLGTAAFHEANNARRIIKEIGLRRKIFEKEEAQRRAFEEKFFKEADQKRKILETKFEQIFRDERIPLPGEFQIEFLPPEQIFQPVRPMPPPGEPSQPRPKVGDCVCIMVWDPVCGKDGKTYSNACEAKCANVEIASKGSCGEVPLPELPKIPKILPEKRILECTSDLSCPQPFCPPESMRPPEIGCPEFKMKCLEGKCVLEKPKETRELPCAKEGEKINRNPLLGPINQKCCPGLKEIRVSWSYSICQKEIIRKEQPQPFQPPEKQLSPIEQPSTGLPNPASEYCLKLGYKSELRTNPDGSQYGICIFPDGQECEEWKFFRGECGREYKKTEPLPWLPPKPEQPMVCAQIITYKKSGDKCFLCPDACSPIERCLAVPLEKCEERYLREGIPPLPAREESPLQFFKETFEGFFKPQEFQPIQPKNQQQPQPIESQPFPFQPLPLQPMPIQQPPR